VAEDDSESIVDRHMEGDVIVVHEVAQRFVLRLADEVVGLWTTRTTSDGACRAARYDGERCQAGARVVAAFHNPTTSSARRRRSAAQLMNNASRRLPCACHDAFAVVLRHPEDRRYAPVVGDADIGKRPSSDAAVGVMSSEWRMTCIE